MLPCKKSYLSFLVPLLINGCGNDNDSKNTMIPPEDQSPVVADLMFAELVGTSENYFIDLANYIDPAGTGVVDISHISVESGSERCFVNDYSGTHVNLNVGSLGHCKLDIVSTNLEKLSRSADANLPDESHRRMLVNFTQADGSEKIRPFSVIIERSDDLNTGSVGKTVDLTAISETGPTISSGYALNSESIVASPGITAIADGNKILLTTTDASLASYIVGFTLDKKDPTTNEIVGSKSAFMGVTVTDAVNTGPFHPACMPAATSECRVTTRTLSTNTEQQIDLATTESDSIVKDIQGDIDVSNQLSLIDIESPLGGNLQIIDSSGASVDPEEQTLDGIHSFKFSSSQVGEYPITYTVTDGKGGFLTGFVNIFTGKLTSPNTPLVPTPGRMVETVQVQDWWQNTPGSERELYESGVLSRPRLFAEDTSGALGDADYSTGVEQVRWAFSTHEKAEQFCRALNMELPTAEMYESFLDMYETEGRAANSMARNAFDVTATLGWPTTNSGGGKLAYLVRRDTGRFGSSDYPTIDISSNPSGERLVRNTDASDSINGLFTCVNPIDKGIMETVPSSGSTIVFDDTSSKTVSVGSDSLKYKEVECTSADLDIASCDVLDNSQVRITPKTLGSTVVTIKTNGESLEGSENNTKSSMTVVSRVGNSEPTVASIRLNFEDNNGTGLQLTRSSSTTLSSTSERETAKYIRPSLSSFQGAPITGSFQFSDADSDPSKGSSIEFFSKNEVSPEYTQTFEGNNMTWFEASHRFDPFSSGGEAIAGSSSVVFTPKYIDESLGISDIGESKSFSIGYFNINPSVTNFIPFDSLCVVPGRPQGGAGGNYFCLNDVPAPTYQFNDENLDGERSSGASFSYDHKNMVASAWPSSNNPNFNQGNFFTSGNPTKNELRVRMTTADIYGAEARATSEVYYPVLSHMNTDLILNSTSRIRSVKTLNQGDNNTLSGLQNMCRNEYPYSSSESSYSAGKVMSRQVVDEIINLETPLRARHVNYATHPWIPYENKGQLWYRHATNNQTTHSSTMNSDQLSKRSLVCHKGADTPASVVLRPKFNGSNKLLYEVEVTDPDGSTMPIEIDGYVGTEMVDRNGAGGVNNLAYFSKRNIGSGATLPTGMYQIDLSDVRQVPNAQTEEEVGFGWINSINFYQEGRKVANYSIIDTDDRRRTAHMSWRGFKMRIQMRSNYNQQPGNNDILWIQGLVAGWNDTLFYNLVNATSIGRWDVKVDEVSCGFGAGRNGGSKQSSMHFGGTFRGYLYGRVNSGQHPHIIELRTTGDDKCRFNLLFSLNEREAFRKSVELSGVYDKRGTSTIDSAKFDVKFDSNDVIVDPSMHRLEFTFSD